MARHLHVISRDGPFVLFVTATIAFRIFWRFLWLFAICYQYVTFHYAGIANGTETWDCEIDFHLLCSCCALATTESISLWTGRGNALTISLPLRMLKNLRPICSEPQYLQCGPDKWSARQIPHWVVMWLVSFQLERFSYETKYRTESAGTK